MSEKDEFDLKIENVEEPTVEKKWWQFWKKSTKKSESIPIHQLFRFASKLDLVMIFIAALCSAITGAIQPVSIIFMAGVLTRIAAAFENMTDLLDACLPLILITIYLATGTLVASYIANCFWILTGENQAQRIKRAYMHAIMHQEMAWFDKADEGSIVTRLSSDVQLVQDGISEKFGLFVMCISQFVAGFIVAFIRGWNLAVIVLACAPIMSTAGALMGHFIVKYTIKAQDEYAKAGIIAEQAISGVRTVYAFSLQERFGKLFENKLDKAAKAGILKGAVTGIGYGFFMFSIFATYGLSFWYGSKLMHQGTMDGGTVLIVFYSMMVGATSLLELPPNLTAVSSACGAAYKVFDTIDRKPEIDRDEILGKQTIKNLKGNIKFDHVQFKYPTRPELTILNDFNLTIEPGQTVALVGPSGSGKSTTVSLLQRLYDPIKGNIFLDGINTKDLRLSWLRQQIGVVSQEPVLFNMSIRQNILLGVMDESTITEKDLINACTEANCHSFISKLPDGYDTLVGESGSMLSGGQKQRIAIARAILKNPPILLLDEATSALDTQSERLVQKALDNAAVKRTTIVIAHRLSTIRNADKIVVIKNGDIVETGTHQELVHLGGIYSDLVKKQEIQTNSDRSSATTIKEKEELDEDEKLLQKIDEMQHDDKLNKEFINVDAYEVNLIKEEKEKAEMKKHSAPFRRVFREMRPELPYLILGLVGSVIAGAVFPCWALFFSRVIANITTPGIDTNPPPFQGVNLDAFLFFVIALGAFIGFSSKVLCFEAAGEKYARRLRTNTFQAILKQEVAFFDEEEHQVGALTTELAVDARSVHEMVTNFWGEVLQAIATSATGLIISFVYSWILTLIILIITPLIAVATHYETRLHNNYQDKTKRANAKSGEVAGEAIKQIRTVTSLDQQQFFEDRYARANKRPHELAIRRAYLSSLCYALLRGMVLYTNAIAFYAGIRLMMINKATYLGFYTSMTCIMIAAQGVGHASTMSSAFAKAKVAAISVFRLLDRKSQIDPDLEGIEPAKNSLQGDVDFKNIDFHYPSRKNTSVFSGNLSLHGDAGKTIALVGPSGCGKSTSIGLLERWYAPLSGSVSLDTHNVDSFTLKNLRSHMALVGQEPVLFDMTVAENIRFGVDSGMTVTDEQVIEACKQANIHEFITSLPNGYETRVGDKGSQLSGGQKQRIAIARALIRKPTVLLLDEATSALDSDSEKVVQAALDSIIEKGGRTTITIAHRLSTIQNSDIIYVIKDGEVVEKGTHWELLALDGMYASLVREQSLAA